MVRDNHPVRAAGRGLEGVFGIEDALDHQRKLCYAAQPVDDTPVNAGVDETSISLRNALGSWSFNYLVDLLLDLYAG